jgi:hypothetical protein
LANDKPGIDDSNIGDLIEEIVGEFFLLKSLFLSIQMIQKVLGVALSASLSLGACN